MSSTGRFYVVDQKTGRKFCVEPLSYRDEKIDGPVYTNGGISGDGVKTTKSLGGSIRPEDSIITPENGFKDITILPPGNSPTGYIEYLCRTGKRVGE